jgi:ribose transport system substrate-binding protein
MRKTIKLGIWIVSVLLLFGTVTACSGTIFLNDMDKKRNIALIVKMMHGDYWDVIRMGAEAAAKEFDVNVVYNAPEFEEDADVQAELINQSLKYGIDAIILASSDYKRLAEAVERAHRLNVPVVTIDSEVDSPYVKTFIGTDNYEAGELAGERLVRLVGQKGRIGIMSFVKGARNAEQREQGLRAALAKYPHMQIVETDYCLSDPKLAAELTNKMIQKFGTLDAIVALNATAANGTAEEIQKLGLGGKVKIVAFDSTPEEMEYMQDGVIQATLVQNPFSMGYLGVKYALDVLDNKSVPQHIYTVTALIDSNTMFTPENQKLLLPFVK